MLRGLQYMRARAAAPGAVHFAARRAALSATAAPGASPLAPASLVKAVREATGAPMLECRNALVAVGAQASAAAAVDAARAWLRARGVSGAASRSGRVAAQGYVFAAQLLQHDWMVKRDV